MTADRLDTNWEQFRALVQTARDRLDRGRLDAAAAYAQMAGQFAWMNHAGVFASPELEALLARLGEHLPALPRPVAPAEDPRTVLHVITQTYQTGGPTQLIASWLEQDVGRRARVCITRQGSTPPPPKLLENVKGPDGLVRLDTMRGGLMARAAALRALAADVDLIILHIHPYDVVPVIAFAGVAGLPPVVYFNNSDHVFWVGVSITQTLLNMRHSGARLASARRGIDDARSTTMVRPLRLRTHERVLERDEAKRRLGVRPDQVLLVTAADAPKYRPVSRPSFLELVLGALESRPDAVLLAAGPSPDEPEWAAAAERTDGRVRALGRLADVTPLHEAADIYLDSFPFSSLTSLLEAGSFGTPAVAYHGHPEDSAVLSGDTPGIDDLLLCPTDAVAFSADVGRLIEDPEGRRDRGERLQRAIRETHTGEGWRNGMAEVYRFAARGEPLPVAGPAPRDRATIDVLVEEIMARTGFAQGPNGAIRDHLGLLPLRERVPVGLRLVRAGTLPTVRHVSSEWLLPRLGDIWRAAHRLKPRRA